MKHKKRNIILVAIGLLPLIGGVKCLEIKGNEKDETNIKLIDSRGISISALGPLKVNQDKTVTKVITATVLDENAPDKSVDWDIFWADDAPLKEEDISDYLVISPESDGSSTAYLTCKKSFRGSAANLKVTTRIGKFEAVCLINYEGIPSSIVLDTSPLARGEGNEDFMYYLPVTTTKMNINMNNVFGDIGESYYDKVSVSTEGIGNINVAYYNITSASQGWGGNGRVISLHSIKDSIFAASYENKTLSITAYKKVESYHGNVYGNSYGCTYTDKFHSYEEGSAGTSGVTPYFRVNLRCGDALATFNFRIISAVTSVSVANSVSF